MLNSAILELCAQAFYSGVVCSRYFILELCAQSILFGVVYSKYFSLELCTQGTLFQSFVFKAFYFRVVCSRHFTLELCAQYRLVLKRFSMSSILDLCSKLINFLLRMTLSFKVVLSISPYFGLLFMICTGIHALNRFLITL